MNENPPVGPMPRQEPPTPDVDLDHAMQPEARVPGAPVPTFSRLPTGPVAAVTASHAEPEPTAPLPQWMVTPPIAPHRGLGAWAMGFAVVGLVASLFVSWGLPASLVGVVLAAVALRRPLESRPVAAWALGLGIVGVLYSAGWLVWAVTRMNLG